MYKWVIVVMSGVHMFKNFFFLRLPKSVEQLFSLSVRMGRRKKCYKSGISFPVSALFTFNNLYVNVMTFDSDLCYVES